MSQLGVRLEKAALFSGLGLLSEHGSSASVKPHQVLGHGREHGQHGLAP